MVLQLWLLDRTASPSSGNLSEMHVHRPHSRLSESHYFRGGTQQPILTNPPSRLPHGSVGKESACSAGDLGLIPGSGRSPGEGNGNTLQFS